MEINRFQNFTNKEYLFCINGIQINSWRKFTDKGQCFTSMVRKERGGKNLKMKHIFFTLIVPK